MLPAVKPMKIAAAPVAPPARRAPMGVPGASHVPGIPSRVKSYNTAQNNAETLHAAGQGVAGVKGQAMRAMPAVHNMMSSMRGRAMLGGAIGGMAGFLMPGKDSEGEDNGRLSGALKGMGTGALLGTTLGSAVNRGLIRPGMAAAANNVKNAPATNPQAPAKTPVPTNASAHPPLPNLNTAPPMGLR